jgi:transcriptional regulator with PAS, ATPase and Fis domain
VNCAALNENLLESELFGYMRGAFTGATTDRKGLFEAASTGTIFLDEVEAMSKNLQVKLLRVLQDMTFFPVGSTTPVTVDVRVIAATNQDLTEAIKTKNFREDLYYRLNVIRIDLPALRDRADDIPLIARYFMAKYGKKLDKHIRRISDEAMSALITHKWPGNIRELENAIERAVVVAETDEIRKDDLPAGLEIQNYDVGLDWSLERAEKEHILKVLNLAGGNKKKAAKLLGVDPTTVWRKLQ